MPSFRRRWNPSPSASLRAGSKVGKALREGNAAFAYCSQLHLAAHFLVGNGLALIEGGKTPSHLLPEPGNPNGGLDVKPHAINTLPIKYLE
jgi:hypothetical protein